MKIIVGLGNPGKEFERTRHNLGFMVIDEFAKKNRFPKFKLKKEFLAMISEKKIGKEKIVLAKPQTFMNNSGKAVKLLIENWKLKIENLTVVHDDLDIPFGKIKISFGRGSAGHKGVQSIIDEIGTKNFVRFRVGIGMGNNETKNNKAKSNRKDLVLQKFSKKEEKALKRVIDLTCKAIEISIKEGVGKAMSEFNK